MSEEELERVKGIIKRLYAGTGVTFGDIVDTAPWLDKLVNEVEELQKEIEINYISKDIIRDKIKEVAEEPQIYVDTEKFDKEFEKSNYIIEVLKELLGE